jgi:AraC-like DNA-binding protein
VQDAIPTTRLVASLLADIDEPIDTLRRAEIATALADVIAALARADAPRVSIDSDALERVRSRLAADPTTAPSADELERIAGHDRFTIARQFRRAFGTSPDRYRTLRRLELARAAIEGGVPLARAAADAGFADQSHMTRQFKRTYGLTPARWARTVARG